MHVMLRITHLMDVKINIHSLHDLPTRHPDAIPEHKGGNRNITTAAVASGLQHLSHWLPLDPVTLSQRPMSHQRTVTVLFIGKNVMPTSPTHFVRLLRNSEIQQGKPTNR